MKPEKLTILNNKREKLVGYFYKNKSKTIVIICHGIEPNNGYPGIENVFEWYHSMGASIFSFDFSGHGESEGKQVVSHRQRVADIKSVLDYFSLKYKDIILYGVSLAGAAVVIAATKYKTVTKLITVNGLFIFNPFLMDIKLMLMLLSYLISHPYFWAELYFVTKNLKIQKIKIPTLVVYGEKDNIVNPKQSIYVFNKLRTEKKLIAVPDGDHPLMKEEYFPVTKGVPEWIGEKVVWK